jgi:hypothetical protein
MSYSQREEEFYDSGYSQGHSDGFREGAAKERKTQEARVKYLEELLCVSWDYLKGHYNPLAMPIRLIKKEAQRISAREKKKNAIQRSK